LWRLLRCFVRRSRRITHLLERIVPPIRRQHLEHQRQNRRDMFRRLFQSARLTLTKFARAISLTGGAFALVCVLFCVCLLTGCVTQSDVPTVSMDQSLHNHSGLSLAQARQLSLQLYIGQSQDEVQKLLGSPDETAAQTMGQNIGKPWHGLVWDYRWGGYLNPERLSITFAPFQGQWLVNNWQWWNF